MFFFMCISCCPARCFRFSLLASLLLLVLSCLLCAMAIWLLFPLFFFPLFLFFFGLFVSAWLAGRVLRFWSPPGWAPVSKAPYHVRAARPAGEARGGRTRRVRSHSDRRSSGTRGEGEGEGTPAIRWACGPPGFDGNPFR